MTERKIIRVGDVMKEGFDLVDGKLTVKEALLGMKHSQTRAWIIDKRHPDDEYGIVLISDIAKKVLGADRSPERVNLYEIMTKPVLSVPPEMDIRYCARLLEWCLAHKFEYPYVDLPRDPLSSAEPGR